MNDYFNSNALTMTKSFTDIAIKAQTLALEGFERVATLNLKTIENRMSATADFWSQAAEARDFEDMKTMWPKGVNLMKETAEKFYANGQEVFGITLKTSEALSQLAKGSFENANDNFKNQVNAATNEFAHKAEEFTSKVNAAAKKVVK